MLQKIFTLVFTMIISGCPHEIDNSDQSKDAGELCRFCIEKEVNIKEINHSNTIDGGQ